jgi:hypothetical protein
MSRISPVGWVIILAVLFVAFVSYLRPGCLFTGGCGVTSDQDQLYDERMRELQRGR